MEMFKKGACVLYHGDFKDVIRPGGQVDLLFTSPPYNIGSKCPKKVGRRRLGGYDLKSWGAIEHYADDMDEAEYQKSQHDFLVWCSSVIKPDGVIVYNHKLRHKDGRLIKPDVWFPKEDVLVLHDEVVWDRGSTHNHCPQFVYPQSERLYVLKKPGAKICFENRGFWWEGDRTAGVGDVWRIGFHDCQNGHNAPFALKLARQVIRLWSRPGDLVCDPYSGSGTTMVACMIERRRFIGAEIEKKYFKMASQRASQTEVQNVG